MAAIASQITSLTIVYSTVYSDADQRKHQSAASLAFVRGIHRGPVNFPYKWPVTRKMFPFDDVIMGSCRLQNLWISRSCWQQRCEETKHWSPGTKSSHSDSHGSIKAITVAISRYCVKSTAKPATVKMVLVMECVVAMKFFFNATVQW